MKVTLHVAEIPNSREDNLDMVGIYADQDLITNNLFKVNSNIDDYRASCYLLNSENENVKQLPQYEKAHNLISDIVEYFKLYKAELIVETAEEEKQCREKEMDKKYYDIFSNSEPFVDDVEEFNTFVEKLDLSSEDIINLLVFTLENNVSRYIKGNN